MSGLVRNRPLVSLSCLILLNLGLLSVQVRSQQGRLLIRSWALLLVTPVAEGIHWSIGGVSGVVKRYTFLYRAREENEQLLRENAQLKLELSQLRGLRSLLSRSKDFELVQKQYHFETELSGVIWKSAPFFSHRLLINAGGRQGVFRDAAVIAPEGIVGRVVVTTPFSSEVELITNTGAAVGVVVGDSRLEGVVSGDGSDELRLNFIPNFEKVEEGTVVYTSGTDRVYPKGLPVGHVVNSRPGEIYRNLKVRPFVDFSRIEEVMVVVSGNPGAAVQRPADEEKSDSTSMP